MTTAKDLSGVWNVLSHKIIASVLCDTGAVFPVLEVVGRRAEWFPGKDRPVWHAVLQCIDANTPPTIEAVGIRLNGNTPPGYIQTIASQFNDEDNRLLRYNTEQLRDLGVLAQLRQYGRKLADTDQVEDVTKAIDEITTDLGGIAANYSTRASDAKSVSDAAWERVTPQQGVGIPTGLKWFDDLAGGLWQGMNYWFAAPYKSGKTTLMRNGVLASAKYNYPVGVFCAEGSREMFALDCQAMLATEILLDQGWRNEQLRLSGLFIQRYYWQTGVMKTEELNALNEARQIWGGLPVFIWDAPDGITNLQALRYLVKKGRVHYGIKSFWGDYSQLFGDGHLSIYERQSAAAMAVQSISTNENVAFCMLTQKNEEGVKGGGGYSANVKGGGDAAAAADFMFIPGIDRETPNVMTLLLKHSRHTRSNVSHTHLLQPSSGLIIDRFNA